jgi:3'(2'), 5'-bisphosphate nucleotidase
MATEYAFELTTALAAANHAAHLILSDYAELDAVADAPATVSTKTDRAAQDAILADLHAVFPDDAYMAEEPTALIQQMRTTGPRRWIIDPIDGTRGFVKKNGEFSIMIALVIGTQPVVAVVNEPVARRTTYAVRGEGCWWQAHGEERRPARVSTTKNAAGATLVRSHSSSELPPAGMLFARQVITYSAGIKLGMIARGEGDLYFRGHDFNSWDLCAGHLLVEEAGGRVTNAAGGEVTYREGDLRPIPGVLATNGLLHDAALDFLRRRTVSP